MIPTKSLVAFVVAELVSGVRYQVQSKHGTGGQKMANEKRLIDANDLKNEMLEENPYIYLSPFGYCACSPKTDGELVFKREEVLLAIDSAPTVDAVEVVHGRWEQVQMWATKAKYRCSVCGREIMSATKVNIEKYPYCHCGAKMDGDGNG